MAKKPEAAAAEPEYEGEFRLIHLGIHDVKRIEVVEIDIDSVSEDGAKIVLTGDNEAGKSSTLSAIEFLLTGKGLVDPVRHGAAKGVITGVFQPADGENFTVERVVKAGAVNGSLIVRQGNRQLQNAQAFLDGLTGYLAFDPAAFSRMNGKDQALVLREALGLDFSRLESEAARIFTERTDVNRDLKRAQGLFENLPPVPLGVPDEEQSADLLSNQMLQQQALVNASTAADTAATRAEEAQQRRHERMESLRKDLAVLVAESAAASPEISRLVGIAERAEETADVARAQIGSIQQQLAHLTATNKQVANKRERKKLAEEIATLQADTSGKTKRLDEIKAQKETLLREAHCPVAGLEFGEDGITVDKIPFSQLSTGRQVRVAASIAMVANPRLRIILIREGSLINRANLAAICDFARESGWQVWIERFQEEPGSEGLHITEGHVSHMNGVALKAAALGSAQKDEETDLF